MEGLYHALGALLATVLGYVGVQLNAYLQQKIKNESLRNALSMAAEMALSAVKETAQVYAGALKDAAADGKLTAVEGKEARDKAMAALKRNLGKKGMAELERVLGHDNAGLESFLVGQLEAAVTDLKGGGRSDGNKNAK